MTRVPANIHETDFLAFVESDRSLAAESEVAVLGAMAADAALAGLVTSMRADRAVLVSLGRVRAPAGLLEGALDYAVPLTVARHGRCVVAADGTMTPSVQSNSRWHEGSNEESLASIIPDDSPVAIPISSVVFRRPGALQRAWRQRGVRQLARAASLAIVAAGGVWLALSSLSSPQSVPSRSLAQTNNPPAPPGPDAVQRLDHTDEPAIDRFAASPSGQLPAATSAATNDAPAVAAADSDPSYVPPAATSAPMPPAEALQLARDSRLAIRIRTRDADAAARAVQRIAERPNAIARWRPVEPGEAAPILVAMAHEAPLAARPAPPTPTAPAVTVDDASAPLPPAPIGPAAELLLARPDLRVLYAVEMNESESDLAALAAALTGKDRIAEFVALDQPLPRVPSLEPSAVLWWTRSPAQWTRRATVPIVLERAGR